MLRLRIGGRVMPVHQHQQRQRARFQRIGRAELEVAARPEPGLESGVEQCPPLSVFADRRHLERYLFLAGVVQLQ
jgi:hypothetical protein